MSEHAEHAEPVHHADLAVVWPRSPRTVEPAALAPRPESLHGKTVAFLWDYLFRGDEIFPMLQRELSARFEGIRFIDHREFGTTHGEGEHAVLAGMAAKLRSLNVDAVISGMGC